VWLFHTHGILFQKSKTTIRIDAIPVAHIVISNLNVKRTLCPCTNLYTAWNIVLWYKKLNARTSYALLKSSGNSQTRKPKGEEYFLTIWQLKIMQNIKIIVVINTQNFVRLTQIWKWQNRFLTLYINPASLLSGEHEQNENHLMLYI